ncbi:hypothetical protein E2C01_077604 [Portunus trituberculatus]|uniref:Uncharacterized protein n=1 Tax=Portunus trituberculatus TaxID=210409 RepID=A0A5B7IKP9_PORTR|nr:hypothetical protein [Portunus trituberculatus]
MKRLRTREAFLWPANLPILPHMLKVYDFSFFLERSTLAFTMAKPSTKPSWESLYRPLHIEVWGLILPTVIVVFIVLMVVSGNSHQWYCCSTHIFCNLLFIVYPRYHIS